MKVGSGHGTGGGRFRQTRGQSNGGGVFFNGRMVAFGRHRQDVRISEAATGRPVANCLDHEMAVDRRRFAPDARHVASASNDKTVKIFEASTGRLVASCHGHQEGVKYVMFSPNGQYLVSAGWDAAPEGVGGGDRPPQGRLPGHGAWINHAVFSPDGRYLASCSHDASVKLWMPETGRLHATCHGHQADVNCLGFSSDGRYLASASADKTVRLWRLEEPTSRTHAAKCSVFPVRAHRRRLPPRRTKSSLGRRPHWPDLRIRDTRALTCPISAGQPGIFRRTGDAATRPGQRKRLKKAAADVGLVGNISVYWPWRETLPAHLNAISAAGVLQDPRG